MVFYKLKYVCLLQAAIVAIIAATLFLRTHLHPNSIAEGQLYSGFLFFSLLQMFFSGIAEMTFAVSSLLLLRRSFLSSVCSHCVMHAASTLATSTSFQSSLTAVCLFFPIVLLLSICSMTKLCDVAYAP